MIELNNSQKTGFVYLYFALILLFGEGFLTINMHWIFALLVLPSIYLVYFTIKYMIFEDD